MVVGVSEHEDPALGAAPFAREDAQRMASFLESPRGGGLVAGRDLLLLTGEAATRVGVLDAIAAVTSARAPGDEVILYLAGQGTTADGAAVFLPRDASAADPAGSGLALADLIGAVGSGRRVILCDASFDGPTEEPDRGARARAGRGLVGRPRR